MRFLVRLVPTADVGQEFLDTVRSLAKSVMAEVRNPKWTSSGALEVDVFAPTDSDFAVFLAAVEPLARIEFSRNLSEAPSHKTKSELISEARQFFKSERFWEAHENLESVWRTAEGEEKRYLQGVILVCAAFVHHQKREEDVALGVLQRAAKQLAYSATSYHGIGVSALEENAGRILKDRRFFIFSI